MYLTLALISAFVLLYSLGSGRIESWPVSGALISIAFGVAFGPAGLGWLELTADERSLSLVAELTLAVVLSFVGGIMWN